MVHKTVNTSFLSHAKNTIANMPVLTDASKYFNGLLLATVVSTGSGIANAGEKDENISHLIGSNDISMGQIGSNINSEKQAPNNDHEIKRLQGIVQNYSQESTNKICSFSNITHDLDRVQCLGVINDIYKEAIDFPDYFTDLFASRRDVFKNDIVFPKEALLSYVHGNIKSYTRERKVHDVFADGGNRKSIVEVNREKLITDIHNWIENYIKYNYSDEKIAISLVQALGGKIGDIIDNSTGLDGKVNIAQQEKSYSGWAAAVKKFFDKLEGNIYEDADGSKNIVYGEDSEATERAKFDIVVDGLSDGYEIEHIEASFGIDGESTIVSEEQYKDANLVFAALGSIENTGKALVTKSNEYASSSQLGITYTTDVKVIDSKKPQDGRMVVGEYWNYITQLHQDGNITISESESVEEVLSNLSEGSKTAYEDTMEHLGVLNTGVVSHGSLVGGDNPDMTLMGTPDNPMIIVQGDYTYKVVLGEHGTYSITKHKGNILQHYKVKQVRVKNKFGVSYEYTTSAPVSLDIKQLFTVGASYKDGVVTGKISTEYIKKVGEGLIQSMGIKLNLDTQEGLSGLFKLYLPKGASLSISSGEYVSLKFPSLDLGSFKFGSQVGIKDGKATPSATLEFNPIENWSDDQIRDAYIGEFKRISEDKESVDEILKRAQSLGMEIDGENIEATVANIIDLMIIQEFESKGHNINPKINLLFNETNRNYVFHSLDSLLKNIASIFSIDITKINRGFEARGVPYTYVVENKDAENYLLSSGGSEVNKVKAQLAQHIGSNSENIRVYSQVGNQQTEITQGEVPSENISEISLNSSRDLSYVKVVYQINRSKTQVSEPETQIKETHESEQSNAPEAQVENEAKQAITNFSPVTKPLNAKHAKILESYSHTSMLKGLDETDGNLVDKYINYYSTNLPTYMKQIRGILSENVSGRELELHMLGQLFWQTNKNMAARSQGLKETIGDNQDALLANLFNRANASRKHASEYSIGKERYEAGLDAYTRSLRTNGINESTFLTEFPMRINIYAIDGSIQEYIVPAGYELRGYNKTEIDGATFIMGNFDCFGNMTTAEVLEWEEDTSKPEEAPKKPNPIAVIQTRTEFLSHSQFVEGRETYSVSAALTTPRFEKIPYGDHIYQATGEKIVAGGDYSLQTNPVTLTLEGGSTIEITHVPRPTNVNKGMTDEQIRHAVVNYLQYHPRITQNIQNAISNGGLYTDTDIENLKQEAYAEAIKELEGLREYFKEDIIARHGFKDGYELYANLDKLIEVGIGEEDDIMKIIREQNTDSQYGNPALEIKYILNRNEPVRNTDIRKVPTRKKKPSLWSRIFGPSGKSGGSNTLENTDPILRNLEEAEKLTPKNDPFDFRDSFSNPDIDLGDPDVKIPYRPKR